MNVNEHERLFNITCSISPFVDTDNITQMARKNVQITDNYTLP